MSTDMDTRLADLALRMATVFSTPSVAAEDVREPLHPADSLLGEDLPQLAQAMLALALRMLDPLLAALRHLAAGTPEAGVLEHLSGATGRGFDSAAVRIESQDGRLAVQGCNTLPSAFLPWIASNLVGAGALLVPHPFSDPESLRRHIGETLLRIERLTVPHTIEQPITPEPRETVRTGPSGEITPAVSEASVPATAAPESAEVPAPSSGVGPESARVLTDRTLTGGVLTDRVRTDPHAPKR